MDRSAGRAAAHAMLAAMLGLALFAPAGAAVPQSREEAEKEFRSIEWQNGPLQSAAVGDKAKIDLPEGSRFLAQGKTDKFFELTGNLPHPGSTVIVGGKWFAVFSFTDSGYIKDDEKIDADALLKAIQEADGPSNEERARRGFGKIHTLGWAVAPHYDPESKHLEWGIRLQSEGESGETVNYTMRLLGRTGYESVVLVASPEELDTGVRELRAMLAKFDFNSGERYSEFKAGDRIAEYGLGALIVGGAAAAAVKTGFWKVLLAGLAASWKFVVAGVVALGAAVRKLFSGKSSSGGSSQG